jgi:hypothetical protein
MKTTYLKLDSRNRVSLTKITKNLAALYRVHTQGDKIILEPIKEIPEEERWLFDPENKKILEHLKESLKQEASFDLGSFKKYSKK